MRWIYTTRRRLRKLTMASEGEFSVWIFFPDGYHVDEARWIDEESAVRLAKEITMRPAVKLGIIDRVIITDGGDCIAFEWNPREGVIFPK